MLNNLMTTVKAIVQYELNEQQAEDAYDLVCSINKRS